MTKINFKYIQYDINKYNNCSLQLLFLSCIIDILSE